MEKNRIKKIIIIFVLVLINIVLLIFVVRDHVANDSLGTYIESDNEKLPVVSEKVEDNKILENNIKIIETTENKADKTNNHNDIVDYDKLEINIKSTDSDANKEVVEMELYSYIEEVINVESNGDIIYGIALIPDIDDKKFPLVIMSHGLGGSHINMFEYAEYLVTRGIAVYLFDFTKTGHMSSGDVTKMSVLTEVDDLNNILDSAKKWDFVDTKKIILMGLSQGGLVSSIVAKQNEKSIKGLILCYPAFSIPESIHKNFKDMNNLDEINNFEWTVVGKKYITDMWNYDVYSNIIPYKNKVLILHGDLDTTVPIRYSEFAKSLYSDCDLKVIHRASHIFKGTSFDKAINYIMNYLKEIYIFD